MYCGERVWWHPLFRRLYQSAKLVLSQYNTLSLSLAVFDGSKIVVFDSAVRIQPT